MRKPKTMPTKKPAADAAALLDAKFDKLRLFHWGLTQAIIEEEKDRTRLPWAALDDARIERCAAHLSNGSLDLVGFPAGALMEQRTACERAMDIVARQAVKA